MAKPMQSVDPTLLALNVAKTATQNAKKKVLPSLSTQAIAKPSLNVQTQQPQAISTNITPPVAKIGGLSSPFGAPNINSAPVLGGVTPSEIGTRAKELQSLPKAMPQTGAEPKTNIRDRLSTMGGDIVLRGKGLAEIKQAYPEFAHIDDETFKKIGGDIALRGKGIDDILRDYPELQQKINTKEKTTAQQIATPFVRFARGVADVGAGIQEGIDTGLSKLGILPDQTAINRKARVKDEEMTQQILGKKAGYEQYVQEGGRIAGSFIANAPANKLGTVGKMALGAAEGLLGGATYNLSTGEGVGSPVNLGLSTAIGAVVPGIVPAFKAIKGLSKEPSIRTAFAESLKEGARTNVAKALAPTGKKYKQLTDRLIDEFLDRGLRGSKESLLQSAKEGVEKFGAKIDDAIAGGALDNVEIPTQPLKELLQEAKKSVMVGGNVVNTAKAKVIDGLGEVLTPFQNTIGGKEARRFKQILDEIVYSTKGGIGAEDMTYKNILSKGMADVLRKQLSEAAPDLAKLNKDFSFYKSLEDVLEATMLRQRPQQGAVRKFIAGAFAGNQEGVVNKVVGYVGSKLFLDATSGATRNTLSAVAKNKLANAIATGSPKVINKVVSEINSDNQLRLPYFPDEVGNTIKTKSVNAPAPLAKTPPITVEEGTIGMGTPKVTVLPPKPTVAPSVGEVKTTSNGVISNENKKILTDYLEKHEKARNNYIKSVYETYDGDTAKSYIKERDNKYGPKATQARDALGIKRTKKSSSDVQAEKFFKGLQKEQGETPSQNGLKPSPKVLTPPAPKNKPVMNLTNEAKPKVSDSLAQEARKYKTADEFIKAQTANPEKGVTYFAQDGGKTRSVGKVVGIEDGKVKMYLSSNPKNYQYFDIPLERFKKRKADGLYFSKDKLNVDNSYNKTKGIFDKLTDNEIKTNELKQIRQDAQTTPPAPKGFNGLGKETMEQNITKADDSLIQEAKKYKSAEEFRLAHQSKSLLDLSDPKRQRWGRLLEDGVDEDTGKYMDLTYTTQRYSDQYKYYPDSKVPKVTNPDQEVTIYRGTTAKQGEMMPGDFVTFSKDYALSHNEGAKLLTKKVPAKDVVWQGNDFSEWIYSPESMRGKTYDGGLEKIREQANKKPLPPLLKKGK